MQGLEDQRKVQETVLTATALDEMAKGVRVDGEDKGLRQGQVQGGSRASHRDQGASRAVRGEQVFPGGGGTRRVTDCHG